MKTKILLMLMITSINYAISSEITNLNGFCALCVTDPGGPY